MTSTRVERSCPARAARWASDSSRAAAVRQVPIAGAQAPLGELAEGLQALDALLAQLRDPALDELVVGHGGAEAVVGLGLAPADLRLEPRQPVEQQRLVRLARPDQRRRQLGQLALVAGELRRQSSRHRQGQERHHAVSVDLEQPLHHAPGLAPRQAVVEDEQTAEAVAMDAEVGQRRRDPAADRGPDQAVTGEQAGRERLVVGRV